MILLSLVVATGLSGLTDGRIPWVSDLERERMRCRVCSVDSQPGTPEGDATRFYADTNKASFVAFNYDEGKAGEGDYILEDPLRFSDGRRVADREDWTLRRRELLDLFEREVYGRLPPKPAEMGYDVVSEKISDDRMAVLRTCRQYFRKDKSGPVVDWLVIVPRHARGRVPVFLHLNYAGIEKVAEGRTNHFKLPWEMLIANGYAFMSARYSQITADNNRGESVTNIFNGVCELWGSRDPQAGDNPGTLMIWAWGLMRGLDLAERMPELDATRNVVIGSSRIGKAALLAAAYDERFKVCIPNQTGAVGVQLMKRDYGETLKGQHLMFPHWYCQNVWKYEDDPKTQPFDQHLLLACVAPRALLLECYHKKWFDPKGEWLAARAASPVWEFLTGKGLENGTWPEPYSDELVRPPFGYVRRTECHGLSPYDWKWAIDFANAAYKGKGSDVGAGPLRPLDVQALVGKTSAGGIVRIPAGDWEVKPFSLKSDMTLHLEDGARLYATTNRGDYAVGCGRRGFVSAVGATNLTIRGGGVLVGRGHAFKEKPGLKGESQPQALPVMIRFIRCANLRLEGFTYRDCGAWGCHLQNCDGVTMRGVTCFSHVNNTNDGIDIESSNVLVEDCDIDSDDDAIVFKTESDRTFPVTNVVIRNCRMASCCSALKFGTGSYCDFRDIRIEGCRFGRPRGNFRFDWKRSLADRGVREDLTGLSGMSLEVVDGGRMENVTVRDIDLEGYIVPIFIRLQRRHEAPEGCVSYLRNILIEEIRGACATSRNGCSITGVPGLRPSDITIRNVSLSFPGGGTESERSANVPELEKDYPEGVMFGRNLPAWAFYLRHVDNVRFENVTLSLKSEDARERIVQDDCTGVVFR